MALLKSIWQEVRRTLASRGDAGPEPGESVEALARRLKDETAERRQQALGELRLMARAPDASAQVHCLLGDADLQAGALDAAESAFRKALQVQPEHARAQEGLGLTLLQAGRPREAYLHLETAHRLAPMNAEVLTHWGLVDLELGNLGGAASKFQRAIERDPRNRHAWNNLGLVLLRTGDVDRSVRHFEQAISLKPDAPLVHLNLARALRERGDLDSALGAAKQAVEFAPGVARGWVTLATLHLDSGDLDAAREAADRALACAPGEAGVHIAQAMLKSSLGDYAGARASYLRALELQPNHPEARNGLGQLELLLSEWAPGWDHFEARREIEATPVRRLPFQEWQGTAEPIRRVLVHSEQGLGDIILFSSCLPDLQRLCSRVVVETPPRLAGLVQRSFPALHVVAHDPTDPDTAWLGTHGQIDLQVPLGSLPRWLRRHDNDFGQGCAFLVADTVKVAAWRDRLAGLPGRKVGVTWRGGKLGTKSLQRSILLDDLARALASTGASLVCLQYGDIADELAACEQRLGIRIHEGLSGYGDLDELAALTSALDGVVTVCSTQAHLSGALGCPALVMVPSNPSWRYGMQGGDMRWYRSITLSRQAIGATWASVLDDAAAWVKALPDGRQPGETP